jgi:hypothetical protein
MMLSNAVVLPRGGITWNSLYYKRILRDTRNARAYTSIVGQELAVEVWNFGRWSRLSGDVRGVEEWSLSEEEVRGLHVRLSCASA